MSSNWIKKIELLKQASYKFSNFSTEIKNEILAEIKNVLSTNISQILQKNKKDILLAEKNGISKVLIERMLLTEKRVLDIVKSVEEVILLEDYSNKVIEEWLRPNGLKIQKVRVPLGVILMVYESRPNVTVDSAVLCIKSGNCIILRGGSETINTNNFLVQLINKAIKIVLEKHSLKLISLPILFVNETSYDLLYKILKLDNNIDLVIPRGGEKMVNEIRSRSVIPVLSHGSGNCHTYVDEDAEIEKSLKVCLNAKVQRPSVCNATEKLLVHRNIAEKFLPKMAKLFLEHNVELRGCKHTQDLLKKYNIKIKSAKEDDWYKEYLDLIIAIKIVDNLDEAIMHINKYGSHHSETIMTQNVENQKKFVNETDSSAIFINSSTRLHDGGVFGFGTEIGISTSKLHSRGTMGLKELSTTKYIVFGDGNVRE